MCISTETLWRSCKPYTDWNDADFVLHPTLVNDHYVTINDGLVLAVHKDSVLGDFHCLNQHGLPADIAEDIDYLLAIEQLFRFFKNCMWRPKLSKGFTQRSYGLPHPENSLFSPFGMVLRRY